MRSVEGDDILPPCTHALPHLNALGGVVAVAACAPLGVLALRIQRAAAGLIPKAAQGAAFLTWLPALSCACLKPRLATSQAQAGQLRTQRLSCLTWGWHLTQVYCLVRP